MLHSPLPLLCVSSEWPHSHPGTRIIHLVSVLVVGFELIAFAACYCEKQVVCLMHPQTLVELPARAPSSRA